MSFSVRAVVSLIEGYRRWISPLLGRRCRFEPTCSAYALQAVKDRGAIRGLGLAVRRVARCHPWNPGGVDPVPGATGRRD
jgi:uncharacterized protein